MGIKVDPFGVDYGTGVITIHNVEELLALPVDSAGIVPDKTCRICTYYSTKPVRGVEGQTLNEAMEKGWLPPHNGCQGKVLLEYKTGEFIIDPRFPTSYTLVVPFSPKTPDDLLEIGTIEQWIIVKSDLGHIFMRYLKRLNIWGVSDSLLKILVHEAVKKYHRECETRAKELLSEFRQHIDNQNIKFCFAHLASGFIGKWGCHSWVVVYAKYRKSDDEVETMIVSYDPWIGKFYTGILNSTDNFKLNMHLLLNN